MWNFQVIWGTRKECMDAEITWALCMFSNRRWCIHTTNHVQCSGISKDMYRQNKWNNLEMETINIICCNSIKSPFWKCCEMDSHPHPRGMILRVILSQLRRLTLTELLELMQAIIETMNDRYANGCIGDTYDPSGYTDDSEASDDLEAMEPQAWYILRSQPWCTYRVSLLYVFADCKSPERTFGQKLKGLAATYVFADCVDWLALWPTTKKKQLARSISHPVMCLPVSISHPGMFWMICWCAILRSAHVEKKRFFKMGIVETCHTHKFYRHLFFWIIYFFPFETSATASCGYMLWLWWFLI